MADTVGFIKKLPHQLVESFKATFEEMAHADLLIEVADLSDPDFEKRMDVVAGVLKELGLFDRPRITVFNKSDLCESGIFNNRDMVLSAKTGSGVEELARSIDETLRAGFRRVRLKLDHNQGEIMSILYRVGHVISKKHYGRTVRVDCELPDKYVGKYSQYIVPL